MFYEGNEILQTSSKSRQANLFLNINSTQKDPPYSSKVQNVFDQPNNHQFSGGYSGDAGRRQFDIWEYWAISEKWQRTSFLDDWGRGSRR